MSDRRVWFVALLGGGLGLLLGRWVGAPSEASVLVACGLAALLWILLDDQD